MEALPCLSPSMDTTPTAFGVRDDDGFVRRTGGQASALGGDGGGGEQLVLLPLCGPLWLQVWCGGVSVAAEGEDGR